MINEKAMRTAAKELNEVLGLDPAIETKAKLNIVTDGIKSALSLIDPKNDEFTEETQAVIDEMLGKEDEEEVPKKKVKGKKVEEPEEEEEDEEPEEEEEDEEPEEESLKDQVNAAPLKLSALTAIVKANPELKPLVKKLATFEKASALKAAILELIAPEEDEPEDDDEEEKPVKKGAKKVAKADDDDEEDETPKKKGAKTPFKGTKETLGTNRGIECAKAMQSIKGSKSIDEIAAIADAKFVKAGGTVNIKQDKNIIKVFLPAAIEWGIVIQDKNGKLSNP